MYSEGTADLDHSEWRASWLISPHRCSKQLSSEDAFRWHMRGVNELALIIQGEDRALEVGVDLTFCPGWPNPSPPVDTKRHMPQDGCMLSPGKAGSRDAGSRKIEGMRRANSSGQPEVRLALVPIRRKHIDDIDRPARPGPCCKLDSLL